MRDALFGICGIYRRSSEPAVVLTVPVTPVAAPVNDEALGTAVVAGASAEEPKLSAEDGATLSDVTNR